MAFITYDGTDQTAAIQADLDDTPGDGTTVTTLSSGRFEISSTLVSPYVLGGGIKGQSRSFWLDNPASSSRGKETMLKHGVSMPEADAILWYQGAGGLIANMLFANEGSKKGVGVLFKRPGAGHGTHKCEVRNCGFYNLDIACDVNPGLSGENGDSITFNGQTNFTDCPICFQTNDTQNLNHQFQHVQLLGNTAQTLFNVRGGGRFVATQIESIQEGTIFNYPSSVDGSLVGRANEYNVIGAMHVDNQGTDTFTLLQTANNNVHPKLSIVSGGGGSTARGDKNGSDAAIWINCGGAADVVVHSWRNWPRFSVIMGTDVFGRPGKLTFRDGWGIPFDPRDVLHPSSAPVIVKYDSCSSDSNVRMKNVDRLFWPAA